MRRGPDHTTTVSITPRPNADDALKKRLATFRRNLAAHENADVIKIIEEASFLFVLLFFFLLLNQVAFVQFALT